MPMPNIIDILSVIFDDLPYGVSIGTPNGKVVCYNRAMEVLSGYSREDVNTSGWFNLVFPDPDRRDEAVKTAKRSLNGRLSYTEAEIVCRNQEKKKVAFFLTDAFIDHRKFNFGIMIPLDEVKSERGTVPEDFYGLYRRLQVQLENWN